MSETAKDLVSRHFQEIWNGRNLDSCDELISAMLQIGVIERPGPPAS